MAIDNDKNKSNRHNNLQGIMIFTIKRSIYKSMEKCSFSFESGHFRKIVNFEIRNENKVL